MGHFYQPDPLLGDPADPRSQQPYGYALGDPLRYRDPSGLQAVCDLPQGCGGPRPPIGIPFPFLPVVVKPRPVNVATHVPRAPDVRQTGVTTAGREDLEKAIGRQVSIYEASIALGATVTGLELIAIGAQGTLLVGGLTVNAAGAAATGTALVLAPAGALLATATVGVALGGAALAGFGLENAIRIVNLQTGGSIPTPNQLLGRDLFPVLPSARAGSSLDRTGAR